VQSTTGHSLSLGAWIWAIAVSILPFIPFALVYGIYGLSVIAQTALLLFSARLWIRPGKRDRNVAAVALISVANGLPIFLIWGRLRFCSGVCLHDSVPSFLGIFMLLGGLMLVALIPLAVLKSLLPASPNSAAS
jgi:hypothetical protein